MEDSETLRSGQLIDDVRLHGEAAGQKPQRLCRSDDLLASIVPHTSEKIDAPKNSEWKRLCDYGKFMSKNILISQRTPHTFEELRG